MAEEAPSTEVPPTTENTHHATSSPSDLMANAKAVAEAAKLASSQQTDKIDKAKVAEAAEELIDSAQKYGKLDEKQGVGQYLEKAESYLHGMHGDHATGTGGSEKKEEEKEGGGMGGVMKMAQGLFK